MSTATPATRPLKVALAMAADVGRKVFPPQRLATVTGPLNLLSPEPITDFSAPEAKRLLAEADVLLTGWGCPMIDGAVLDAAPRLQYVLHAGGSPKHHVGAECWDRGIQVSTAADANAIPVAEYTLAMILLATKRVLQIARELHRARAAVDPEGLFPDMGNYGKRVGIIGASKIGRHVIHLLKSYELEVVLADPFVTPEQAAALGVELVELEELMETSDVVSLHAPSLPATRHMIDAGQIARLRPGATFINTSRGELVDQDALLLRLEEGELYAVLDVTTPWVLPTDSGFYTNPNVLLTPHLAGSLGTELERLAASAIDEAYRAARGEALRFPVKAEELAFTA